MALRISTGLRDKLLEEKAKVNNIVVGTGNMSFVDGGAGNDTITDTGNSFGSFIPGDKLTIQGTTSNDGIYEILAVTAGQISVATGSWASAEAMVVGAVLASAAGFSLKDIFRNCCLKIYSGPQPPTGADAAIQGTLLVVITNGGDGFPFVHGNPANGLNFGDAVNGAIGKAAGEVWSGKGLAANNAGWFRIVANPTDDEALNTVAPRIDGSIATSGAQLNMSNTSISLGGTTTIDSVSITLPAS